MSYRHNYQKEMNTSNSQKEKKIDKYLGVGLVDNGQESFEPR